MSPSLSRRILAGGVFMTVRMELFTWDALEDIGRREGLTVAQLCARLGERLAARARRGGLPVGEPEVTLPSAARVFVTAYYRRACTEDGHKRAGHGRGDPFAGTPFELAGAA